MAAEEPVVTEAPSFPNVLFTAPAISKDFAEAERAVDLSAVASGLGLGAALLGIAPFTAPNYFLVAMLLATFQVNLAHTWQTRVLRAQARRHIEEVVQLDEGRFSIRGGHGLERTLHLSHDAAEDDRPPLSEVLLHGGLFVFLDRTHGTDEAPEALEAMLQSSRSISSEDLVIATFEGESQDEADKLVQNLAKISSKELRSIAKQQKGSTGPSAPKLALAQAARSAQAVAGTIFLAGTVICVSGRTQANQPPHNAAAIVQ